MTKAVYLTFFMLTVNFVTGNALPFQRKLTLTLEDRVQQKVHGLKEVKNFEHRIDSLFDGIKTTNLLIRASPNKGKRYYWIQVGINDSVRFTPVYNFYVYPSNMEVRYYDADNDKILTLQKWRKNHQHSEYLP